MSVGQFKVAVFVMAKDWTGGWISLLRYSHTVGYFIAVKTDELPPQTVVRDKAKQSSI